MRRKWKQKDNNKKASCHHTTAHSNVHVCVTKVECRIPARLLLNTPGWEKHTIVSSEEDDQEEEERRGGM